MNVRNSNHIIHHVICTINIFLYSVDRASLYNLANETNLVHNIVSIFRHFYLQPLHFSDLSRSIIRRNNCIYMTLGILLFCIASCLVCRSICSCTPDSQLYRILCTRLVSFASTINMFMQNLPVFQKLGSTSLQKVCLHANALVLSTNTILNKISQFQSNTPFVFISLIHYMGDMFRLSVSLHQALFFSFYKNTDP